MYNLFLTNSYTARILGSNNPKLSSHSLEKHSLEKHCLLKFSPQKHSSQKHKSKNQHLRNKSLRDQGFTLLEILITLTIVSILTAVALPQYSDYKKQAFDARSMSDLRNVAISEEAYFMQSEKYISCKGTACTILPGMSAVSKGVILEVIAQEGNFTASASHPQGSTKIYRWDSARGGMVD